MPNAEQLLYIDHMTDFFPPETEGTRYLEVTGAVTLARFLGVGMVDIRQRNQAR